MGSRLVARVLEMRNAAHDVGPHVDRALHQVTSVLERLDAFLRKATIYRSMRSRASSLTSSIAFNAASV